jgi:uncharacterized paraquat-inducible protein A
MRFLQTIKPWGMIEVFMLGILVSLVKAGAGFQHYTRSGALVLCLPDAAAGRIGLNI